MVLGNCKLAINVRGPSPILSCTEVQSLPHVLLTDLLGTVIQMPPALALDCSSGISPAIERTSFVTYFFSVGIDVKSLELRK
jgi:hypothetical protein